MSCTGSPASPDTNLNAVIQKGSLPCNVHRAASSTSPCRATRISPGTLIHGDQKPSNVLVDASCTMKLCYFGLARSLGDLPTGPKGQALTQHVATQWYRALEVLLSSRWYTPGVDMWSLGCLGEMLGGWPLFPCSSALRQLELVLETIPLLVDGA
ncbi:LOW QUALITY PROTEIN: mitogen-activated protein kinase 15-like [Dipodomys merriami]|uniref:LOW QUALITY PROTEIN: mitogen-activated protein kinase 15-like n=1 Tax=Dipodomys merriami TaxID=94247 RepID=UPI0038557D32